MKALGVLGRVEIPEEMGSIVAQGLAEWRDSGRLVWEQSRRRQYQPANGRTYLSEDAVGFLSGVLTSLGIKEFNEDNHGLLLFGDVELHDDGPHYHNRRPAMFFHLMLSGSGTLRFPGLRDKQSRNLEMTKGLAFWFNPRIAHLVKNASDSGLASLTAAVRLPRHLG